MDLQSMLTLAQRLVGAPDNAARAQQIMGLTPDRMLSSIGLSHRPSTLGAILPIAGALVVGAAVGAGMALLLAPTTGPELQSRIRTQVDRLSSEAAKVTETIAARVADAGEKVPPTPGAERRRTDGHADGARA